MSGKTPGKPKPEPVPVVYATIDNLTLVPATPSGHTDGSTTPIKTPDGSTTSHTDGCATPPGQMFRVSYATGSNVSS